MPIQKTIEAHIQVYLWADELEETAQKQLQNLANLDIIYPHIAAMPDVHWGIGATVGSVIPCLKAIIPAAVGVDLGCGMLAAKLNLHASDLPDHLYAIRNAIEKAVPHGRTHQGGRQDRGAWHHVPDAILQHWKNIDINISLKDVLERHPRLMSSRTNTLEHLGTLGTGNHFIELCLDEQQQVWIMLHSGSRGIGNRIGTYFIELAKQDMKEQLGHLPDQELAYFKEGSRYFADYVKTVAWGQNFAQLNRQMILEQTLSALKQALNRADLHLIAQVIQCHHNYVAQEQHYGKSVWVTRKGAIRAEKGDYGIIPGSMGTQSYIVRGKGNPLALHSCSHGAGRKMSRGEAKRRFSTADLQAQTQGVECRIDQGVLDEIPEAYKNIERVMELQSDLVEVVHTLKQVVCVKG